MLNVVKSPSKLSHPRQHVYAGRVGVITSYLSLACAYAHAWTDPYLPQGQIIGLSVVGVLQLMFTTGGWLYIRQALRIRQIADALRPHDAAAREAAVREVNRWTEPTPSLLLVFRLGMPPLLTDVHGRPAQGLDARSASHEAVVAKLREVQGALTSLHTTAMVTLFYGACCGPRDRPMASLLEHPSSMARPRLTLLLPRAARPVAAPPAGYGRPGGAHLRRDRAVHRAAAAGWPRHQGEPLVLMT